MKVKVEYSNNYRKIMSTFKSLPRDCERVFLSACKRDALNTIKNFHDGIKNDALGLKRLKDGTIVRKRTLGYPQPSIPLYGKGDEKKNDSYMNMLRIKPIRGKTPGFLLHIANKKHWNGDIDLKDLWDIHEHGAILKNGKIPPRPALEKAFKKSMRERDVPLTTKIIKTAIVLYLKEKKTKYLVLAEKHFLKGLKKYERIG